MSLILVIEQEGAYTERIRGALTAEGWTIQVVPGRDAAMAAAAKNAPDLVLVSTSAPGAVELLRSFGRAHGGPGAMALVASGEGAPAGADGSLAKPFTDEQLRVSVRRTVSRGQKAAAEAAAARAASTGAQLTSQDLFGDLLAEVEEEAARPVRPAPSRPVTSDVEKQLQQTLSGMLEGTRTKPAPKPASPPPPAPAAAPAAVAPPAAPPAPVTPPAEPAAAPRPPAPTPALAAPPPTPAPPRPTAPPAAAPAVPPAPAVARPTVAAKPRPADSASDDVEDLLSQTLSGLGVASRPRRTTGSVAPAAAAAAAAAPSLAPPPAAAPPSRVEPPRMEPPPPLPQPPRLEPPAAERTPPAEPPPAEPPRREPPPKEKPAIEKATPPPAPVVAPAAPAGAFATMRIETTRPPAAASDQFGAYTLLDRVALGGMAEVWKARMKGVEGFQKTVAIKKILPHLTDSVDFVTMFIDEAKLAAQLNHPNIIHIYDLGKLEDDYYIAMEYVEGKDLRSILNNARRRDLPLSTGMAMLIAARLASALDYAHRKRDFDNRELGLVHRDVSPQNVLISYEGDIKLCDFGIVKAVAKASKTQMGALKGKLQYMSPEQAWGRVVDARSDIFSLGSVLFEMLTGRRLFAGESEISVLEAVRECRIQSVREVDPTIPEGVGAIVRRALAKDPDDRYQTAGEMQKELDALLYTVKPTPSQGELAAYMHRLFSDEVGQAPGAAAVAASSAAVPGAGAEVPAVAPVGGMEQTEEGSKRRSWVLPAAAALVLVVSGIVFWLIRGGGIAPTAAPAAGAPVTAPAGPTTTESAVVPAAAPALLPGAPTPVPSGTTALEARMQQDLQAREEQLKAQLEAQRKQIQAELAAQPSPTAAARPSPTQVAAAPAPPPAPAPTVRAEEPPAAPPVPEPAQEPDPPPAEEPIAAPAPPAVREGDLVAPGTAGLTPPAFVSVSKPEYPALAKRLGVQGVVTVSVLVNEQGVVEQARLVRGVQQKVGINEAAMAAARSARYRPATLNGVRVKTWANLSIPFKL
jgi:TonB family protein